LIETVALSSGYFVPRTKRIPDDKLPSTEKAIPVSAVEILALHHQMYVFFLFSKIEWMIAKLSILRIIIHYMSQCKELSYKM
jgi:hypothetical protein